MSVKIEILDYKYSTGINLVDVNQASSVSGWTVNSPTSASWDGSGTGTTHLSDISSSSLIIGRTYNLSFSITNKTGVSTMGFSSSSGVSTAARSDVNGAFSLTFVATGTSFPDLYGQDNNSGTISNIVITEANVIDWDNSVVGELDVTDNSEFPLAMTFQISDFKDLTSTSGDYSKTFKVPATKNNNNIFKHIYIPNIYIDNNVTSKKSCRVIFNNLYSLVGLIQVDGVGGYGETPSYYNCVFFGSNLSWASDMQDSKMNEIEWGIGGDELTYNKESIVTTWQDEDCNTSPSSYIVYPITSYGDYNALGESGTIQLLDTAYDAGVGTSSSMLGYYGFLESGDTYGTPPPVADWRPSVFVKNTLDKIFEKINYRINSTFMETDMFKKLVWLLPNFKYNNPDARVLNYSVRSLFKNEVALIAARAGYDTVYDDGIQSFTRNPISQTNATVGDGINKGNYYFNGFGAAEFDMSADNMTFSLGESAYVDLGDNYITIGEYGEYLISLSGLQSRLALGFKGGGNSETLDSMHTAVNLQVLTVGNTNTTTSWKNLDIGTNQLSPTNIGNTNTVNSATSANTEYKALGDISLKRYFNKGDKIRLTLGMRLHSSSDSNQNFGLIVFFKSVGGVFNLELNPMNVAYGQTYNLNDVINSDYKQIDFIKGISHAFNLQMTTDESTRTINIEPFDDFYKPYSEALDWTYKLDRSSETSDKWLGGDLKRNLVFKYKSDDADNKVKYRGEEFFLKIQDEYPYITELPDTFKKGDSLFENPFFAGTFNSQDQDTVKFPPLDTAYSACLWKENVEADDVARPEKGYDFLPRLLYWNKYSPVGSGGLIFGIPKRAYVQTWLGVTEIIAADSTLSVGNGLISNIYPQATMVNRDSTTSPNLAYGNVNVRDYDDATGIYTLYGVGKGLYDTYYNNMIGALATNPSLRTLYVSLNITDIVNLDFRKLVYIAGVYWRVNKIVDYKPNKNEPTKVELIEWIKEGSNLSIAPQLGISGSSASWSQRSGNETNENIGL